MSVENENDWHRLAKQLGPEHQAILQGTLPTVSFGFLLESYCRESKMRLQTLDTTRDAQEFKQRYHSILLKIELAEDLLAFVKSLSAEKQ